MAIASSLSATLRTAATGARTAFLVAAGIGLALVLLGVVLGVRAHKAYGSALMLPFFIAALVGTGALAARRQREGVRALGVQGKRYILAAFVWNVASLTSMLVTEWFASSFGLLGREPNELLDSIAMVLVVSAVLSVVSALPSPRSDA